MPNPTAGVRADTAVQATEALARLGGRRAPETSVPGVPRLPTATPATVAARFMMTSRYLPDLFRKASEGGDISDTLQAYIVDQEEMKRDPDGFLKRNARLASDKEFEEFNQYLRTAPAAEVAGNVDHLRTIFTETRARTRILLPAFRELAVQAGYAHADDPQELLDEAAMRLQGDIFIARKYEETSPAGLTGDFLGTAFIGDSIWEHDLPDFGTLSRERVNQIRSLPPEQRFAVTSRLLDVIYSSREGNVLKAMRDIQDVVFGTEDPEAIRAGDYFNQALNLIDGAGVASAVMRGVLGRLSATQRLAETAARRRVSGKARSDFAPPPKATEAPAAEAPTDAPRTAQEPQEGASAEGGATPLQGQPAEAPTGTSGSFTGEDLIQERAAREGISREEYIKLVIQSAAKRGETWTEQDVVDLHKFDAELLSRTREAPAGKPRRGAQAVAAGDNPEVPLSRADDLDEDILPLGVPTPAEVRAVAVQGGARGQKARDAEVVATGIISKGTRVTRGALQESLSVADEEDVVRQATQAEIRARQLYSRADMVQGGVVGQRARDAAVLADPNAPIPQGTRVSRTAIAEAAEEAPYQRAAAPRPGEPVIGEAPVQNRSGFEDEYLSTPNTPTRVEPTVSGPAKDYLGSGWDAVRDYQLRNMPEGPVSPSLGRREPTISDPDFIKTNTEQLEEAAGTISAAVIKSPSIAKELGVTPESAFDNIIPGAERTATVSSPEIGDATVNILNAEKNKQLNDLNTKLLDEINRIVTTGTKMQLYTAADERAALTRARRLDRAAYIRNLGKVKDLVTVSYARVRKTKDGKDATITRNGNTMTVRYKITDESDFPAVISYKDISTTLGPEDIKQPGDIRKAKLGDLAAVADEKHYLQYSPGRTVDMLVENMEIHQYRMDELKNAIGEAVKDIFRPLTKTGSRRVQSAHIRSFELGNGVHAEIPQVDLLTGTGLAKDINGESIHLSMKEWDAYDKMRKMVATTNFLMNIIRTKKLKEAHLKVIDVPGVGSTYGKEVGAKYNRTQLQSPMPEGVRNLAGFQRNGKAPEYLDWRSAWNVATDPKNDYKIVMLEDMIEEGDAGFQLVLVPKNAMSDIPDLIPFHQNTWIPQAPQGVRFTVVRERTGVVNGVKEGIVSKKVVAKARSRAEAEVYMRNMQLGPKETANILPDNSSRWTGDIDLSNNSTKVKNEYVDFVGFNPSFVDPVTMMGRALNAVATEISLDGWREAAKARWVRKAKKTKMLDEEGSERFHNAVLNHSDPKMRVQLERERDYINQQLNIQTEEERLWSMTLNHIADTIAGAPTLLPKTRAGELVDDVRLGIYTLADKDPVSWFLSLTRSFTLGMWNPAQIIVQSMAKYTASLQFPQYLPILESTWPMFRGLGAINFYADQVVAATRLDWLARGMEKMGVVANRKDAVVLFERFAATGKLRDVNNVADLNALGEVTSGVSALKFKPGGLGEKAANSHMMWYREGELMNRINGYMVAVMNYAAKKYGQTPERGGLKLREFTDKDWREVFADSENLTLNMSRASKAWYQNPKISVGGNVIPLDPLKLTTQFFQVFGKSIATVGGTSRMVTGQKKTVQFASLVLGQGMMYGASGLGASGMAIWAYKAINGSDPVQDARADPDGVQLQLSALQNGIIGASFYTFTGEHIDVADRVSIGNGIAEQFSTMFSSNRDMVRMFAGASYNWFQEIPETAALVNSMLASEEDIDLNTAGLMLSEPMEGITSFRNMKSAMYDMYLNHRFVSRSGVTLEQREYSTTEIFLTSVGFAPSYLRDYQEALMDSKAKAEYITEESRRIAEGARYILAGQTPEAYIRFIQLEVNKQETDQDKADLLVAVSNIMKDSKHPLTEALVDAYMQGYSAHTTAAQVNLAVEQASRGE